MMNLIRKHWRAQCGYAAIAAMQRLDYKATTKWLRRAGWVAPPTDDDGRPEPLLPNEPAQQD